MRLALQQCVRARVSVSPPNEPPVIPARLDPLRQDVVQPAGPEPGGEESRGDEGGEEGGEEGGGGVLGGFHLQPEDRSLPGPDRQQLG